MGGWVWMNNTSTSQIYFALNTGDSASYVIACGYNTSVGVYVQTYSGVNASVSATTAPTGQWFFVAGVIASVSSRTIYLNQNAPITDTNTVGAISGLTSIDFGYSPWDSSQPLSGKLAEWGLWDAALTTAEIASLAAGVLPPQVRPLSLVGYWPLYGLASPEPDLSGNANNGTLTGTTYATGPPVELFGWGQGSCPYVASSGTNYTLNGSPGTFSVTGDSSEFAIGVALGTGSYSVSGDAAQFTIALESALATYTVTGYAASLIATGNQVLNGSPGTFNVTGSPVEIDLSLGTGIGSFSVTGDAVQIASVFNTSLGTFSVTASPIETSLVLNVGYSTYSVTGSSASLVVGGSFVLNALPGTFIVTGYQANLINSGITVNSYLTLVGAGYG
ncbi:unnamed protein product [Sphagnum balticum]